MDEPQITDQVDNTDAISEKNDLNEVLDSEFTSDELEKPMDVDEVGLSDEPSTSAEVALPVDVVAVEEPSSDPVEEDAGQPSESAEEDAGQPSEPAEEDAGQSQDVSMSDIPDKEPDQTVEQVIFDNPSGELDETAQSGLASDALDFTEHSINISQLDVEHHDDSNDAFNALKESETDALQEPKEETSEPKENEETADIETDVMDVAESDSPKEKEPTQEEESAETPMEIGDISTSSDKVDESTVAEEDQTVDESREIGTETFDLEDNDSIGCPASNEKPENEEAEDNVEGE